MAGEEIRQGKDDDDFRQFGWLDVEIGGFEPARGTEDRLTDHIQYPQGTGHRVIENPVNRGPETVIYRSCDQDDDQTNNHENRLTLIVTR
jgi:hypothetical protein